MCRVLGVSTSEYYAWLGRGHGGMWSCRRGSIYIEAFYNRRHRHSSLGYVSPAAFERASEQEAA